MITSPLVVEDVKIPAMSCRADWADLKSRAMPLLRLLLLFLLMRRGDSVCRLQGSVQPPELAQDGDLVIGGIFSFRTGQDYVINTFQTIPDIRKCNKYVLLDLFKKRFMCILYCN